MDFKRVEGNTVKNTQQSVFTYKVNMIVSVFAENERQAREQLDSSGGFVSFREVDLADSAELYRPE